jgi:hypothetical protein
MYLVVLPIRTGIRPSCDPPTTPDTEPLVSLVLLIVSVVATRLVIVAEATERTVPENPLRELTGPVKVVEAIENYLMHESPIRLCIVR